MDSTSRAKPDNTKVKDTRMASHEKIHQDMSTIKIKEIQHKWENNKISILKK